ncbi:MAG: hypothetical protein JWO46_625 [Nocardioidaceae bacterium]|nr:hypothetical protein [Nocardioidaceae bacterium]
MEPLDPQHLRISDTDRNKVAELLREAAGDGRIDLAELDERLEQAYAAKTYADLVPITVDLPAHHDATPVVRSAGVVNRAGTAGEATYATSFAMMSETRRSGVWDLGTLHTATAVMGSVVLDLRQARFPAGEVVINANAVMGSVEVIVDAHTAVRVDGVGIMGAFQEGRARVVPAIEPGGPSVRLRGVALMGSVEVKRKGPPGQLRRKLLGHGGS